MRLLALALVCFAWTLRVGAVSWAATPFIPASVPLAVRSPYLSAWLPQGGGNALNDEWPLFWTGQSININESTLGWAGFAKVDGSAYVWMGTPVVPNVTSSKATQKSLNWTSTQSIFVMTAGPVDLTIVFLSPVEPRDLINQSLPLSYYSISTASNDGNSHQVQVYADISGEWVVPGTSNAILNWSTTTGDVITHQVQLENQASYTEVNERIHNGAVYHSTLNVTGTTYQSGQDIGVRAQFVNNGALANTLDTDFRNTSYHWPIFAFAHDFGNVTNPTDPVVYSIGHSRDPAIQYITQNNGRQAQSSYFWTRFSTMADAISAFLNDYDNALARANAFDRQTNNDANQISPNYTALVALSIRQTFGAIEITVPRLSNGSFNTSNVLTFIKQLSADHTVNTVDVIYPSWPLFLYTNPAIGKSLLQPLLEYQAAGQYQHSWCVHDMGTNYPNATGHNDGLDSPQMPVEESGNMLIMTLSYTQWSNDTSLLDTYAPALLDQWFQYLANGSNAVILGGQNSSDSVFTGPLANQTNLAIKGIVAVQAMAEIARLMGGNGLYAGYHSIATSMVQQWQQLATSGSHLTLSYGDSNSWGLTYNLYADKLLGTNIFPESVYSMQTEWYDGQANTYGPLLDTRNKYTKSDWSIWTAAIMTSTDVRDQIIDAVVNYASNGKNNLPLGDLYNTQSGIQVTSPSFFARPVVGGHLALLPLQALPPRNNSGAAPSATPTSSGSLTRRHHRGAPMLFTLFLAFCALEFVDRWV